jgi:histone H4
MGENA